MKTPEETRRSLEHCATAIECKGCAYKGEVDCYFRLIDDANGLVQQLEAERDAAVEDIRLAFTSYPGACETCEHVDWQLECDVAVGCSCCENKKCVCNTCDNDYCNWQWRGVQKEE